MTDWFSIRGTYGTAFRAPALYELFLANQIGFSGQLGLDPCINYLTRTGLPSRSSAPTAAINDRRQSQRRRVSPPTTRALAKARRS